MFNSIYKFLLSISLVGFLITILPSNSFARNIENSNDLFIVTQQKTSIDNPVVDPNFNVMRASDTESSTATYIVIGLLIAATIIPLATWWYFSK